MGETASGIQRVFVGVGNALKKVPEGQDQWIHDKIDRYIVPKLTEKQKMWYTPIRQKLVKTHAIGYTATIGETVAIAVAAKKGYDWVKNRATVDAQPAVSELLPPEPARGLHTQLNDAKEHAWEVMSMSNAEDQEALLSAARTAEGAVQEADDSRELLRKIHKQLEDVHKLIYIPCNIADVAANTMYVEALARGDQTGVARLVSEKHLNTPEVREGVLTLYSRIVHAISSGNPRSETEQKMIQKVMELDFSKLSRYDVRNIFYAWASCFPAVLSGTDQMLENTMTALDSADFPGFVEILYWMQGQNRNAG
jgi:hypothetical protein